MFRILLAVLCAFTGLPPVVASASAINPQHDNCCCCAMGHEAEHSGPRLAENPCACGCIAPARTPNEVPEAPRDRSGSDSVSLPELQTSTELAIPWPRSLECKLRVSPVPLRGPPGTTVLCLWQE